MSANSNRLSGKVKKIAMVAANAAISEQTGWPIGFWWAELTHSFWTFTENGYDVDIYSPNGGKIEADSFSDPEHESGYSSHDLISLGFKKSTAHAALLENTPPIDLIEVEKYDALFLAGGQSPMYTFFNNEALKKLVVSFYEKDKIACIVCHATSVLLNTYTSDGKLLVEGKTWTGFADSEEQYADAFTGIKIQPFWIETEARKIPQTNFITASAFTPFAIRDGRLISGQQQYSGAKAAQLVVEALGQ